MRFSNEFIPTSKANQPQIVDLPLAYREGDKLPCRDPYILPYDGKYYLYCSLGQQGIGCYVSDDLKNWYGPKTVFETPEDFHGVKDFFWAPECHYYKGNFYIFTSVYSFKYNHRTISVYQSNNPLGPFEDIADGCISPSDWDAIDGTLYLDKEGQPWMVFVHEWTSMPDGNGGMVAAKLSEDFTHLISEPITLFYAKDPSWSLAGITDGPFLYRTKEGKLLMIWSNFGKEDYFISLAVSDNGELTGKWSHEKLVYQRGARPDFKFDGGHGMIFQGFDGKTYLSMHAPNDKRVETEHLTLFEIEEKGGSIQIK